MTSQSAIEIFEEFLARSTNPRQKESIRRMHKACEYLQQQEIRITPSSIEHYCLDHDWEGPKAQSIRNSPVLMQYFTLRKSGQVIRGNKKAPNSKPLIADETLRAYVNLLIEERDQAIAGRLRIEQGLRSIPGIPIDELIGQGFGAPQPPHNPEKNVTLPPLVKEALGLLFNEQRLSDCGLKLYRERLIHSLTGNVLLERKHVQAIQALGQGKRLETTNPSSAERASLPGVGIHKD